MKPVLPDIHKHLFYLLNYLKIPYKEIRNETAMAPAVLLFQYSVIYFYKKKTVRFTSLEEVLSNTVSRRLYFKK